METGQRGVPFRGKLAEHPLPALIHALHIQAKTGLLKIVSGNQRKAIFLSKGAPVSAKSNAEAESLGAYLLERGLISSEVLERARAAAGAGAAGKDEGAVLLELRAVTPNALFEAIQGNQRLQILGAFALVDGEYAFEELARLPADTIPIKQSAPRLVIDGVAAHYTAERMGRLLHLPQTAAPFLSKDSPYKIEELGFSKEERQIFNMAASGMAIVEICEQAGSRKQALALIFALECMEVLGISSNPAKVSHAPKDPLADAQYRVRVTAPPRPVVESRPPGSPVPSEPPKPVVESRPPARPAPSVPPRRAPPSEAPRRASLPPGSAHGHAKGARASQPQIDPDQPGGESFRMGLHYLGIREYVLASKAFKEAMTTEPDEPTYRVYYGWTLFLLSPEENTPEALGAIKSALAKKPNLAMAHYFLGRIYSVMEDDEKAIKAFQTAIECDPGYREAHHELEKCFDKKPKAPDRPSLTDRLTGWTRKR